jgi:hypothetical protein
VKIDWATVSSLATAGGTLVLAVATFYSVRSSNRAARSAERALQAGLRPVLFPSRSQDDVQKIHWADDHWAVVAGGRAVLDVADGIVYMAMSIRNVGSGIGVLMGWRVAPTPERPAPTSSPQQMRSALTRPDPKDFNQQSVDIYVPPGSAGYWLAALRDCEDAFREQIIAIIQARESLTIDLMYGDQEGGQRTISRFVVNQHPSSDSEWIIGVVRHWFLDRPAPR